MMMMTVTTPVTPGTSTRTRQRIWTHQKQARAHMSIGAYLHTEYSDHHHHHHRHLYHHHHNHHHHHHQFTTIINMQKS